MTTENYNSGDKSQAICPFCKELRTTTFLERQVPLSEQEGLLPLMLVAVCDECDQVVGVPQQSSKTIKEWIRGVYCK